MTKPYIDEDAEKLNHSYIASRKVKWYRCPKEQFDSFFKKKTKPATYDTAIVLLGIYLKAMVTQKPEYKCLQQV